MSTEPVRSSDTEIEPAVFRTVATHDGSERLYDDKTGEYVLTHRLAAVAHYGFETISGCQVGVRNGIGWDVREENLITSADEGSEEHFGAPRRYSDAEILGWIEAFVEEFGVVPRASDIKEWPGPSHRVYEKRFGGVANAVEEAGYTSPSRRGGSDGT